MRDFLKEIEDRVLVFDGSKGYMLQRMGLKGGECPESWNITHSEEVKKVYSLYKEAGSEVIQTNTFPGNRIYLEKYSLGERTYEINFEGTRLAREVMGKDGFVAASIGPTGKLSEPAGDLTFDRAYEIFKEQVEAVADGGADIINFETFTDLAEIRAALIAAKETANLPVICSVSFESNGRMLTGTDPYVAAIVLKASGADMVGTNCSFGPDHLLDIVKKMSEAGGVYFCVKPNAGLPELINGETVYKQTAGKFAELTGEFVKYGVRLIGGCCGATPEYVKAIKASLTGLEAPRILCKTGRVITSGIKLINIDKSARINTGQFNTETDDELLRELTDGNPDFVVDKALELSCEGYEAIYINIDRVNADRQLLARVINTAQGYIKEPFIIETKDKEALADALRLYKGKAGVVVNGYSGNVMEDLLMVAGKYGSTIIDKSTLAFSSGSVK